ncbi:hypothetical protein KIW84_070678 [Lathyrus oleraceus]|uniref:Pentatricopeptide repeat-containing protein n=1 Tax=Pisum sativum TaxID=3888 RepID=A0A9D4ZS60_PEA|nr:hypothetical protein KIW84_070678 [Pisum sativum]
MRHLGIVVPDKFMFPCVIRACGSSAEVLEVKKIHGLLFKLGLELDCFVGNALIDTYLKFGLVVDAQEVFEELHEILTMDELFMGLLQKIGNGFSVVVSNALIDMLRRAGKLMEAYDLIAF